MGQAPADERLCWLREAPVRWPRLTIALLALLTAVALPGVLRLRFDPSTERVFPEHHPAVESYEAFRRVFGSDESLIVAFEVERGRVFDAEHLALARDLARALRAIDGVDEAFSLADVPVVTRGPLGIPTLQPPLPDDLGALGPERLAAWRERVLATPFVRRVLVSRDERSTAVMAFLAPTPPGAEGAEVSGRVVAEVEQALAARERQGLRFFVAGSPLVKVEIMRAIERDARTFAPYALGIAVLAAWFMLRSVRATGIVLGVLAVSITTSMGVLGYAGLPFDPMSSLIPTLLLVIGLADSLHLLVEQRAQAVADPAADGAETVRRALGHVLTPCFLTTLTTAIGFGSLVTSDIAPIRRFGAAAALSAGVAFLVTVTLAPAMAALLAAPRARAGSGSLRAEALARLVAGRPRTVFVAGIAAIVLGMVGVARIRPDTDFLRFFRPGSRIVQDAMAIQERFVAVGPGEVVVVAPPGASRSPAVLQALWDFERALEETDEVDLAFSAADMAAAAVELLEGRPRVPASPAELARIEGLLARVSGGQGRPLEHLVSPDGPLHPGREWLRVSLRLRAVGSSQISALLERIDQLAARHLQPLGLEARTTGTSVVFARTADQIMGGQVESFLWAFVTITVVMALALRSLRLGLVSMIPNLVPIAAILGVMGYGEIPLNSMNSMVVSIAIGIAVDDTIHLLYGFKRFSLGQRRAAAVAETVAHEGGAVVSTSVVLFLGFSVLLLASFLPTMHFGLLTAISIAAALLGDLLLLPALLLLLPGRLVVGEHGP